MRRRSSPRRCSAPVSSVIAACAWQARAGGSDRPAPVPLDAALIFAPDGSLVPKALRDVSKGGAVVCGGIHMSDIPAFPYADLWGERRLQSVANLTRADGLEFFQVAAAAKLRPAVTTYPLPEANRALDDLRRGAVTGAAVLVMEQRLRDPGDRGYATWLFPGHCTPRANQPGHRADHGKHQRVQRHGNERSRQDQVLAFHRQDP